MAKMLIETILVLIPMPRAISGSSTVARMMAPRRVRSIAKNIVRATRTAMMTMNRGTTGMKVPQDNALIEGPGPVEHVIIPAPCVERSVLQNERETYRHEHLPDRILPQAAQENALDEHSPKVMSTTATRIAAIRPRMLTFPIGVTPILGKKSS